MIAVATSIHVDDSVRVRMTEHSTDAGDFVALVLADDEVHRDAMVFGSYDDIRAVVLDAGAALDRFDQEATYPT